MSGTLSALEIEDLVTVRDVSAVAQRLEIEGRSEMTKDELVEAIQKANDRKTAHARED